MSNSISQTLKRMTAASVAALSMTAPYNAAAHVSAGSLLEGYEGFVNAMRLPDGPDGQTGMSCCHLQDGQGNIEEQVTRGPDGKERYKVKLTKDLSGNPLPQPLWIDVPPEAVLTEKYAKEFCDKLRIEQPDSKDAASCKRPPFNVLWTPTYSAAGPHRVYCYIPKPRGF